MSGMRMTYKSKAEQKVKPNVVFISIGMREEGGTPEEAINKINEDRALVRSHALGLVSIEGDSYRQDSVSVRKITRNEIYYGTPEGDKTYTEKEYKRLPEKQKDNLMIFNREIFVCWESNLRIRFTLSYGYTTVSDLVEVFNKAIKRGFHCDYTLGISDDLRERVRKELYAECINSGMKNVQDIVAALDYTKGEMAVNLVEVRDPDVRTQDIGVMRSASREMACLQECAMAEPEEQLMIPELLEDLFNNEIEISKSLDLMVEIYEA